MKGKPWSVEEEKDLRKLASEGKSVEVIAGVLKKSEKAIYMKLCTLGLLDEETNKCDLGATSKVLKLYMDVV